MHVEVESDTKMRFEYVLNDNGKVQDSMTVEESSDPRDHGTTVHVFHSCSTGWIRVNVGVLENDSSPARSGSDLRSGSPMLLPVV